MPNAKSTSKWHEVKDWSKVDFPVYRTVFDATLQKISVPFGRLKANVQRNIQETKIQVNAFCAEITNALLTAEKAAIPVRKIREGIETPGFSKKHKFQKTLK